MNSPRATLKDSKVVWVLTSFGKMFQSRAAFSFTPKLSFSPKLSLIIIYFLLAYNGLAFCENSNVIFGILFFELSRLQIKLSFKIIAS